MSISISLIAVFIPILMMGGIVGRLFREFAITLVRDRGIDGHFPDHDTHDVRLLLKPEREEEHNRLYRLSERFFDGMLSIYRRSLRRVLNHPVFVLIVLALPSR